MRKLVSNPSPQATIDLHFCTKSEAIKRLTFFMDEQAKNSRNPKWVLVITGSGAHSQNGPILRQAVENLFIKRSMTYVLNKGKSSYTVDVTSGYTLFEPEQPTDTKVVVSKEQRITTQSLSSRRQTLRASPRLHASLFDPLPSEVAATDAFVEESRREGERMKTQQRQEELVLKKAVSMSLLEENKEKKEEGKLLQRALSLSMIENVPNDYEDEFQTILELSRKEFERDEAEDPLQRALDLSQKEACQEEEELERVLEQSKICF